MRGIVTKPPESIRSRTVRKIGICVFMVTHAERTLHFTAEDHVRQDIHMRHPRWLQPA